MSWIMTIAVGAAIGYFAYQIFQNNRNGEAATGRLHKSTKDRKVAGVCGGIAEYLNADPTIIRLVFALMVLGWGTGVLAYIVLALVLPEGE
ncbi:MAG: PspC domain-containing protein [Eubacteriales bacterium]